MKQKVLLVLVGGLMALLIAGCGGQATPEPASAPAEESSSQEEAASSESEAMPAPEAIEIGSVIPLTGPFAGGGAQVERGYKMAIELLERNS